MWRDYLSGYLKNNRTSGVSVVLAAFLSALLLSLLCGLFYNAWKYEVERIEREEGGWQSRLDGSFDEADVAAMENFGSIRKVEITAEEEEGREEVDEEETAAGDGGKMTADLYFDDMGAVLEDTPKIAEQVGVPAEGITYNRNLLALYLIRDPQDTAPRLLFPLFIFVTALASFSLIVIIHNAFAVSMGGRIHQFGIFSSIGATPRQIRACLMEEAALLCAVPVLTGNLLGIGATAGVLTLVDRMAGDVAGRQEAVFGYHPLIFALTLLVTVFTVAVSAWIPARKLSRLTPLEAIRNADEPQLKRKRHSRILALFFGVEGELAGNALKTRKKALRTASFSLILSVLAFTLTQCFFTLSAISTRETYFERYQDAWDIMVTVKDTEVDAFGETEAVRSLSGVKNVVVYQKAAAERLITEDEMSDALKANGGFSHASAGEAAETEDGWLVEAPIVIMDDASFLSYCEEIGAPQRLDGAVIWNRIRDVTNPDFRHPEYMPYLAATAFGGDSETDMAAGAAMETDAAAGTSGQEFGADAATSLLRRTGDESMTAEVPVLSYTDQVPVLREEYATENYYELVHFVPVSLWREIKGQIGGAEPDCYIRILGGENVTLEELSGIQSEVDALLGEHYVTESENRIQEYETNDEQIRGMQMILGGFCGLLALIGISNVFSNTLGFVRQRRREFARYMSVGMTPGEMRKMFVVEALVIAGRPVLITASIAALMVWYMLRISYLAPGEFFAEEPLTPIALFVLAIFAAVALAYALGWRGVRKIDLAEALRDDTML